MVQLNKTFHEVLRGKVKWAKTKIPNKFGKWSIDIYPDAASLDKIKKLKEEPAIKNTLKKDEEGQFMTFSRDTQKLIRGKLVSFQPPTVLNDQDQPTDAAIGNGSDCDVHIEVYTFNHPLHPGSHGRAARLHSIKIWNLVPFEAKNDFTVAEQISLGELLKQPQPSW